VTAPDASADRTTGGTSVGRASLLLASGTIVSRVLGFVNATLLSMTIGLTGQGANAFAIANTLPTNIFLLISGGLLSAALVPQIVRAGRDPDGGQAYVNRLVTLGITVFLVVTVVATVAAPLLVGVFTISASGDAALTPEGVRLAVLLAYWCLPQIFFYASYSLLSEVLNARGVFGPFAWAPVANNVVLGATILLFGAFFGTDPAHRDPASWTTAEVVLLGGGATLGIVVQAAFLLLFWRRTGLGFRPDFHWRGVGLGATGRAASWAFGMVVVNQLAGIVQTNVAITAGADDPSVNALRVAWAIFVLPHSLLAVSIATPYFTRMAGHAAAHDTRALAADLSSSLRTVVLLTTGAGAALFAAALPFAGLFATTHEEIGPTGLVLMIDLVGLPSFSAIFLVHRCFYALGDTRTPFLIQLLQSGLFVAGSTLVLLLPGHLVGAGIATLTLVVGAIQSVIVALILRRRLGGGGGRVLRRFVAFGAATLPAVVVGLAVLWLLGGLDPTGIASLLADGGRALAGDGFALSSKLPDLVAIAAAGAAAGLVYVAVLAAARLPELSVLGDLARRFRRR